jgi:hypothetical protein
MVGGSERNYEEALDHRVHLFGHLELVEMPGANGDPDLQVGPDLEQPERVGLRPERRAESSSTGILQRARRSRPFHSLTPRMTAAATAWRGRT